MLRAPFVGRVIHIDMGGKVTDGKTAIFWDGWADVHPGGSFEGLSYKTLRALGEGKHVIRARR